MFRIPEPLRQGDKVALVAPAGRFPADAIDKAHAWAAELGLDLWEAPNLRKEWGRFAASDEDRKADLMWALKTEHFKAVIAIRGGYGCIRLLDDDLVEAVNDKWLIGFSDITTLHAVYQTKGIASIHGPMPNGFDTYTIDAMRSLRDVLFGSMIEYEMEASSNNRVGEVTAPVVGGNLATFQALIGTPYQVDTYGKILFFEEIGEQAYKVDRFLVHLKLAGCLDNIAGCIIGGMSDIGDEPHFGKSLEEMILEHLPKDIPVVFDFPSGHIDDNRVVVLGADATLKVTEGGGFFAQSFLK